MAYRESRNLEASLIDYVVAQLTADGWTNIRTEKSFAKVYDGELPCICINILDTSLVRKEIGTNSRISTYKVAIHIFAVNDGQRLDLSDWMLTKIENDITYYTYTIVNGVVTAKVKSGWINILKITDNRKELTNTEGLDSSDRYRQLIIFTSRLTLI